MVKISQHVLGASCIALLLALRLLSLHPRLRRVAGELLTRLGARVSDWLTPPPEIDHPAAELSKVLRREKLKSDLRRVRRIVATDTSMSATRQIGNRVAYAWLVREWGCAIREGSLSPVPDVQDDGWDRSHVSTRTRGTWSGQYPPSAPLVEILDFGWKR